MRRLCFAALALAGVALWPVTAAAQNEKTPPTLVVRVQSFDSVVQNVKTIAKAVGKEEVGKQLEGLIKAQAGPKGLDGVDTKKPIGIYVKAGEDLASIAGVLMIPIKDEDAFLKLLQNVNYKAVKNKVGVYIVEQNDVPFDIGFRFANGYAYVTGLNLEAITPANLIAPADVFPASAQGLISGVLRVDQIPKAAKDIAITKLDEELGKLKDKADNEAQTPAQKKLAKQLIDTVGEHIADFLRGATDVAGQLKIDEMKNTITFEMTVDGKKNSQLKANIAELGKQKNLFSGLSQKGAAANQQIHIVLPAELKKAFNEFVTETVNKALEAETDANKKAFAKLFFDAMMPTLQAGEFNSGSILHTHNDGMVTVVGGVKVAQGANLEKTLKDLHAKLPPAEQAKFKLDLDKAGGASIHSVDMKDAIKEKDRKVFGDGPLYFAVRNDAVYFALGKDGLTALKQAAAAPPAVGNEVLRYDFMMGKIFEMAAKSDKDKALAKKIFAKDPGMVNLTVEGGKELRIELTVSIAVLEFGVTVNQKGIQEAGLNQEKQPQVATGK